MVGHTQPETHESAVPTWMCGQLLGLSAVSVRGLRIGYSVHGLLRVIRKSIAKSTCQGVYASAFVYVCCSCHTFSTRPARGCPNPSKSKVKRASKRVCVSSYSRDKEFQDHERKDPVTG